MTETETETETETQNGASPKSLSLYHYVGCPFCGIVQNAIDQLGLEVESRDIFVESERRQELVDATGRQTVPCLRIAGEDGGDDRWMHESRDIIDYLRGLAAAS